MKMTEIINQINHCLHICDDSNIDGVIFSYLIGVDIFVTNEVKKWQKKFDENKITCQIKKPEDVKDNMKIVVDGTSLGKDFGKWEKKWEKLNKAICVYNINKLDPPILTHLVDIHDKMLLSFHRINLFTDKAIEKGIGDLSPDVAESLVKKELKNIMLSLILAKPMCGTELVKELYKKFKVLVSPGMLYPSLKELEKKGLLKYEYKLKNKVYSIQEREGARNLLKKHIEANSLLSQFLVAD